MLVNSPQVKKIIQIQAENNIYDNKLLTLFLMIHTKKLSVIKTILEYLDIEKEEFTILIDIMYGNNILCKKDIEFLSKLEKTKIIEKEDLNILVEEVINHLNAITHTKKRVTESRKAMILKWLKQGFRIEDFINVNLLFYFKWHNNINMEQYIRPETLYNSKFAERVEEAEKEFSKIREFKDSIYEICKTYQYFFENMIVNPSLGFKNEIEFKDKTKDLCKYTPFELQRRIAFWLKKGYSVEDISVTIEETIAQWSKKTELHPYINLMKIMDNKFPERVNVSKKLRELKIGKYNKNKELEAWANS